MAGVERLELEDGLGILLLESDGGILLESATEAEVLDAVYLDPPMIVRKDVMVAY